MDIFFRFTLPGASVRANSVDSGSDADSQVRKIRFFILIKSICIHIFIFILYQVNSVISAGGSFSDVESGDEEDNHVLCNMGEGEGIDEVDENKFFAGVITSQRSEEDLVW